MTTPSPATPRSGAGPLVVAGDPVDAVVLAGGEGRRLGGVSKPDVEVAGRSLLDHVLVATTGAARVVVAGPDHLAREGVVTVMEDPPLGGPVAGVDAAVRRTGAPWVLLLACDVPRAARAVPALVDAVGAAGDADGVVMVADGRHQPLVGLYRRAPLVAALDALHAEGGVHGVAVRRLVGRLRLVTVQDADGVTADADTWEAVEQLASTMNREGVS
ncbi:molybdenum cofactor guanylyltransferase [Cellulomonas bogoriensis]